MSLYFVNTISIPNNVPRRARDDFDVQPIRFASLQVNPLTTSFPPELTAKTWRLATVGKNDLLNGARYENALWRVWAQQRLNIPKVDGLGVEWDDGRLFVPLVISDQTCRSRHDLSFVSTTRNPWSNQTAEATQLLSPVSAAVEATGMDGSMTLSIKSCLKNSISTERSDSPLSFGAEPASSPVIHPKRGVVFNSCVAQSVIVEGPPDGDISDEDILFLPPTRGRRSRSNETRPYQDSEDHSTPATPTNSSFSILKQADIPLIQHLPPTQLVPRPRTWESNITYVALPGTTDIEDEHRGRSNLPRKPLTRTRSERNLKPNCERSPDRKAQILPPGGKARFSIAIGDDSEEEESEEEVGETFTIVDTRACGEDGRDEGIKTTNSPGFFANFGASMIKIILGSQV